MVDLGSLGGDYGTAEALNDSGTVVGNSDDAAGNTRAFVWTAQDGIQDLNALVQGGSGMFLVYAWGISNSGLIVGSGLVGSETHAFLLTPLGAEVVTPTTTTLSPGIVVSGSPSDMFTSNDISYVLRPGIVLSSSQSPVILGLSGHDNGGVATSLQMVVESRANQANVRETIEAFNFSSGSYETLNQQVLTLSDVVKTLTIENPSQHIGPGNEVRARISYKAAGPILAYPWRVSIDEATWRCVH